eukprot:scaffold1555_cov173-Amphora_coffeaeformis.AAC.4
MVGAAHNKFRMTHSRSKLARALDQVVTTDQLPKAFHVKETQGNGTAPTRSDAFGISIQHAWHLLPPDLAFSTTRCCITEGVDPNERWTMLKARRVDADNVASLSGGTTWWGFIDKMSELLQVGRYLQSLKCRALACFPTQSKNKCLTPISFLQLFKYDEGSVGSAIAGKSGELAMHQGQSCFPVILRLRAGRHSFENSKFGTITKQRTKQKREERGKKRTEAEKSSIHRDKCKKRKVNEGSHFGI